MFGQNTIQGHIKKDGQMESVNRNEIIMGGVNPLCSLTGRTVGSH